jgi:hypothetical protein
VAIVHRVPDGRIDLQTMRFTDPLAAAVQHLAGRERVVVLGVNEEGRAVRSFERTATASQSAHDRRPCPPVRIETEMDYTSLCGGGRRVLLEMAVSLLVRDIWTCIRPLRIFDVS